MSGTSDKILDRFERKAIMEAEKRKKPGECMKVRYSTIWREIEAFSYEHFHSFPSCRQYMEAIIDEGLVNEPMGAKILAKSTIACKLVYAPIPRTIHWRRSIQQLLSNEAVSSKWTLNLS